MENNQLKDIFKNNKVEYNDHKFQSNIINSLTERENYIPKIILTLSIIIGITLSWSLGLFESYINIYKEITLAVESSNLLPQLPNITLIIASILLFYFVFNVILQTITEG